LSYGNIHVTLKRFTLYRKFVLLINLKDEIQPNVANERINQRLWYIYCVNMMKHIKKPVQMRKLAFIVMSLVTFTACNNATKNSESNETADQNKKEATPSIGGKKDDHGCLVAAGQTWSEIKQGCIQVFNVGLRLNPTEKEEGKAVISAFIVLSEDKSKLELFLPDDDKNTIILDKVEHDIYQKDSYRYDAKKSALYVNNTIKYKGDIE
jgi:hypothetical protein